MKNTFTFFAFIAFLSFGSIELIAATPSPILPKVVVKAGTLVTLETAEKIYSDDATVGQILKFSVLMNVVVDGKVVIASGALAIGRVKSIKKTTYNIPEEITIELKSVQAVDGQQIVLNGDEQTYKGKFTGEGTYVMPGRTITAKLMNNYTILLD